MAEGEQKDRPALPRRKLRVTNYEQIGKTQKDAPIYKVFAVKEDGSPVEDELRAFQELPVGEVIEYALKRYDHPQYGVSFTLYPPKEKLGTRVTKLEQKIEELESRLAALESGSGAPAPGAPDDDIPF